MTTRLRHTCCSLHNLQFTFFYIFSTFHFQSLLLFFFLSSLLMTFFCCKINYKIKNIVVLYVLSYLLPQVVASIHLSINQVIVFLYCMLIVFIYLCYICICTYFIFYGQLVMFMCIFGLDNFRKLLIFRRR
jgi:hypothetical protein